MADSVIVNIVSKNLPNNGNGNNEKAPAIYIEKNAFSTEDQWFTIIENKNKIENGIQITEMNHTVTLTVKLSSL